ncbi:(deoxy)nucleoside triphosphate pyrophosphohydrolase [uncultured Nocardioides sp.]|uniref:(deoxy)nucleoside triphosphate pyrophosphohydrolase n=1 Tax=uncultured Nocardioides sp. TaxID=198441 RepID=UPI000C5FD14C|nr:DNA mismatch repair protein MutT [Nocardioides sp.]
MRKVVVAAAIVRGGRVLAARRTTPPEAAGRWELPGGKCEPGEPPAAALEREIAEELGCDIEVTTWLEGATEIGETHELRAALARLTRGEPEPAEHDEVRWLAPDELDSVDWLEPDRPFLPELRFALEHAASLARGGSGTRRVIVFDEDDARAVEQRLRADGFDAEVVRERLQGEDDDEDHPWAVLTDAPSLVADVLADEFDGWLDEEPEQPAPRVGSPLDLPTAPRRIKRTDA